MRALGGSDCYFPQARQKQIPPEAGAWAIWLILAGRGFGKTRTGAEWIVDLALREIGTYAVMAETFAKGRNICFEGKGENGGPSGILSVLERRGRLNDMRGWNPSNGRLKLTNGSLIQLLTADKPDDVRGWNLGGAWCDELAAWRRPDAFDQLRLAVRIGTAPKIVVTTTPKPTVLVRHLVDDEDSGTVTITRGSTLENAANLSEFSLAELERRYGGTRLGRQELEGELLDDVEGALWRRSWIDDRRVDAVPEGLVKVVVAVDPAVTSSEDSDDTGIIAVGRTKPRFCPVCGKIDAPHAFVIADRTCKESPNAWARRAVALYEEVSADRLVAEVNQGYDLVETTIRNVAPSISYEKVHAKRGKALRAQPVAAVYEQGRVHHVGRFDELEDQCCTWSPDAGMDSPDRLDALVYAVLALGVAYQGTVATNATQTARELPRVEIARPKVRAGPSVGFGRPISRRTR